MTAPPQRWRAPLSARANVTTETLRAFTEDEYREIVAALP